MKRIGVLTSGGDAPGMNAAIRAVVRSAIAHGMEVYGIENGYAGIFNKDFIPLGARSVSDTIQRGGTILCTARCKEMMTDEGRDLAAKNLKEFGIEGLIVIGGDGSFHGAETLCRRGIACIGLPGTIDNDLAYTDYSIGFDTACNTVLDAINRLRDTMSSHNRVSIVEVMGRNCGDIALYAGLGGGAEIILVPEVKFTQEQILDYLGDFRKSGKRSGIIVVAEGAGHARDIEELIKKNTDLDVKSTILGHVQRGGSPSNFDRFLGTAMGAYAVDLLSKNIGNRIVGIKNNEIFDMDIIEGISIPRKFNKKLYDVAKTVV
jgi:6-phosphofructokinase 1